MADCKNCKGTGLDPRANGEFVCPDCRTGDARFPFCANSTGCPERHGACDGGCMAAVDELTRRGQEMEIRDPGSKDKVSTSPAAQRGKDIAFRIRAELVCCEIYGRVNDTNELTFEEALKSKDWHDLCYWGEGSARIAEGQCPGYETVPNVCECDCEGCKHNCGAHKGNEDT